MSDKYSGFWKIYTPPENHNMNNYMLHIISEWRLKLPLWGKEENHPCMKLDGVAPLVADNPPPIALSSTTKQNPYMCDLLFDISIIFIIINQ